MPNLDYFVVCDVYSGTFFGADGAYLLDTRKLTPEQRDILNDGTDSDRGELASELGSCLDILIDPNTL